MWEDRISRLVLVFAVHFIVSTANHEKDNVSDRHLDIGVIDSSPSQSEPAVMKIELSSHDAEQIKNSEVEEIQITRKVPVPVPVTVEKRVPFAVAVPVEQPFPVYIPKPVPFAVHKPVPYHVSIPVSKPYITEENIVHKHTLVQSPPMTKSPPLEFLKKIVKTFKNKLNLHNKIPFHGPPPKPVIKHVPVHIPVEKIVPVPVEVKVPIPVKVKEYVPVSFPSAEHYHFPSTNNEIHSHEHAVASHHSTVNHYPNHDSSHEYYLPEAHKSPPDASDVSQAQQYYNHAFNHQPHFHQPYSLSQSLPKFAPLPDMTEAKFHQHPDMTNQMSNHLNSYQQQSELMHFQNYASTNTVNPHYIADSSQNSHNPSQFEYHREHHFDSPEHIHHQSHFISHHEPYHQNYDASTHISPYIQEPTQHQSNFVPPQSYHYQSNGETSEHQEQGASPSYELKYVSLPHVSYIDANHSHDSHHQASNRYVYNQHFHSIPQMSHPNQSGWVPFKPHHYPRTFSPKPGSRPYNHYHIKMPLNNAKSNRHFGHPVQQYHYNYFLPVSKQNIHEHTKRQFGVQGSVEGPDPSVSASNQVHHNVYVPVQNQVETQDVKPFGPYRSFNKHFEVKHDDGFYPSGPSSDFMKSNDKIIVHDQTFAIDSNQMMKVKLPENQQQNSTNSLRVEGPVPNIVQANLSSIDPFQYIRYAPAVKPFKEHNYTLSAPTPTPSKSTSTRKTYQKSEDYVAALSYTKAMHPSPQP